MKCVIDSNYLRDDVLASFLRSSPQNIAILPDYAAMEALKGDPLVGMYESMRILAKFPAQVQILKTTMVVCGLSGISQGLQRRLVDVPTTREFAAFCDHLSAARGGVATLARQLQDLGKESRDHLARVEGDARGFSEASVEAARLFTARERERILLPQPLPSELHQKLVLQAMQLAAVVFDMHPAVRRLPNPDELFHTYVFRSSLCHLLLGFAYASVGGVRAKSTPKIRNDMVDTHFATYATFFDGLLSRDELANRLYRETLLVLTRIRRAFFERRA